MHKNNLFLNKSIFCILLVTGWQCAFGQILGLKFPIHLIAHRGMGPTFNYPYYAEFSPRDVLPENTLAAIKFAIEEQKADGVEFDVFLTKDNIPILAHRAKLNLFIRVEKDLGAIKDYTFSELKLLFLKYGLALCSVAEVLEYVSAANLKRKIPLQIDIDLQDDQAVPALLDVIQEYIDKGFLNIQNFHVVGRDLSVLKKLRALSPGLNISYSLNTYFLYGKENVGKDYFVKPETKIRSSVYAEIAEIINDHYIYVDLVLFDLRLELIDFIKSNQKEFRLCVIFERHFRQGDIIDYILLLSEHAPVYFKNNNCKDVKNLLLARKREISNNPKILDKLRQWMQQGLDKRKAQAGNDVIDLDNLLKRLNARELIPGWLIRSSHLGAENLARLSTSLVQKYGRPLGSVANLSFFGYNPHWQNNGYALEEFDFCQRNSMTFLHPFSRDISNRIFWDSFNPVMAQGNRNIFFQSTIERYIAPEAKEKFGLKLDQHRELYRISDDEAALSGGVEDVQNAMRRMINSPWPLVFHCNYGLHRTGMADLIFSYMIFRIQGKEPDSTGYPKSVSSFVIQKKLNLLKEILHGWSSYRFWQTFFKSWKLQMTLHDELEERYWRHGLYEKGTGTGRIDNLEFYRYVKNQLLNNDPSWLAVENALRDKLTSLGATKMDE